MSIRLELGTALLAGTIAVAGTGVASAESGNSDDLSHDRSLPSPLVEQIPTRPPLAEQIIITNPPITDEDYEEQKRQREAEKARKYELPLIVISDFVDLDSNPDIAEFYEKISENPSKYIEISGPGGTRDFWTYNGFTYVIYAQENTDLTTQSGADGWSIKVSVEDNNTNQSITNVHIRMGKDSKIYDGNYDNLGRLWEIDDINLGIISDNVFNLPEEITPVGWQNIEIGQDFLGRSIMGKHRNYDIDEENQYEQYLLPDNVIYFSSPYPFQEVQPSVTIPPHLIEYQEEAE